MTELPPRDDGPGSTTPGTPPPASAEAAAVAGASAAGIGDAGAGTAATAATGSGDGDHDGPSGAGGGAASGGPAASTGWRRWVRSARQPRTPAAEAPAGGGRRSPSSGPNRLARLAGAQVELFDEARDDRPRFVALGGVLLTTAFLAAVSSAFALHTALGVALVPSVLAGVVWGVMICNLDRMMVLGLKRQAGWGPNLLSALPRVFLALVIGSVIAVPLVLQIFQPEIDGELQVMRVERQARNGDLLRQTDARIDDQERVVTDLQKRAAGSGLATASDDPEVQRLQKLLDDQRRELSGAEQAYVGEVAGTSGSGVAGEGPATSARRGVLDRLQRETADLQRQFDAALGKAQGAADETAQQQRQEAAGAVGSAEGLLSDLRTQKAANQEGFAAAEATGDGLLARIEALGRLADQRTDLNLTRWTLTVLFALLELLPVIVKLLAVLGPPTAYDRLVARQDDDIEARSEAEKERRRLREKVRTDEARTVEERDSSVRLAARDDLRRRQAALSTPVNDTQIEAAEAMVEQWRRASTAALETWKEVYERLNSAELERWKRDQLASAARAAGEDTQPIPLRNARAGPWDSPPPVAPAGEWERTVPLVPRRPEPRSPHAPGRVPGPPPTGEGGRAEPRRHPGDAARHAAPAPNGSAPANGRVRPPVPSGRLLGAGRRLRRWLVDVSRARS